MQNRKISSRKLQRAGELLWQLKGREGCLRSRDGGGAVLFVAGAGSLFSADSLVRFQLIWYNQKSVFIVHRDDSWESTVHAGQHGTRGDRQLRTDLKGWGTQLAVKDLGSQPRRVCK